MLIFPVLMQSIESLLFQHHPFLYLSLLPLAYSHSIPIYIYIFICLLLIPSVNSCYNLARTINRKRQTNQDFTEKQYEHIHFMMKLTDDALEQMIVVVEHPEHAGADVNKSFNLENEINNYRNQLKNQNILDVNNKEYDYQMGVYYMDIIAECEKLGDYVVNVVEASSDIKEKKAS